MSAVRAATVLAVWGAAHRAGVASPDAALTALSGTGVTAGVRAADADTAERTGLPGPGEASTGSLALLRLLRAGRPTLLLPIAGDVRGVPPRSTALVPALDAGAAVVVPSAALAIVPADGFWRVYCLGQPTAAVSGPALLDVERDLDAAIRAATLRLHALDVARGGDGVRQRIAQAMRDAAVPLPAGSSREQRHASALLAKVISLEALLEAAAGHETAAVSRYELAAVDDALRPLTAAVRAGRLAAVEELISSFGAEAEYPAVDRTRRLASELSD